MPCHFPKQVYFTLSADGKKKLHFGHSITESANRAFREGRELLYNKENLTVVPCGKCMACRLEKSREWAVRCVHEASLYENNCFITLTYNQENLPVNGSLNFEHLQLFMKRLRFRFPDIKIRSFGCGEYGEKFARPHFHVCLFNFDFGDKLYWKTVNKQRLYTSAILEKEWGKGFCVVGTLTFESAAYVARYCTKKINGDGAEAHYQGRVPEAARMSNRGGGIGYDWYQKWKKDVYPSDFVVLNSNKCKPPRYYDKILEREDPILYEKVRRLRLERALDKDPKDFTYRRMMDREGCLQVKFKKLIRTVEKELVL